jgi:hypothetical protein
MSWDIVIFSSKQKIDSLEELDKELLVPVDFCAVLEKHFDNIRQDGDYREITGRDFSFHYYTDTEPVSNKLFFLYGENALFELIRISKIHGWQIFDTGNGEMLDLDHPEKNGYEDFQKYLQHVLSNPGEDAGS